MLATGSAFSVSAVRLTTVSYEPGRSIGENHTPKQDEAQILLGMKSLVGMSANGRLLPVTIRIPSTLDRPLLGDSGHSEKRHRSTDA